MANLWASQVVLVVKNPPANAGDIRDTGSVPGSGRSPGGGHGNPLQYSCLENPYGQRSLAGKSPWGLKESNMIEATYQAHIKYIFPILWLHDAKSQLTGKDPDAG